MSSLVKAESPVARLIAELGGVRPFAAAIGLSPSTVQGWKERGKIPKNRQNQVFERLAARGVAQDSLIAALPQATPPQPQTSPTAATTTSTAPPTLPPQKRPLQPVPLVGEKLKARRRIVTGVAVLVLLAAIVITVLDIFLALPLGYEIPNPAERQVAQVIAHRSRTDPTPCLGSACGSAQCRRSALALPKPYS